MAESILKHMLKEREIKKFRVVSYGLAANVGEEANKEARKVLKKYKIKSLPHRAQKLTDKIAKSAKYIFVMTEDQKHALRNYPNAHSIKDFIDGIDIPDPYGLDETAYEAVFKVLYASIKRIVDKIS